MSIQEKVEGRRYYIEYNDLSSEEIVEMIDGFYKLFRKIKRKKKLNVYTSLPKDNKKSGIKTLKLDMVKKSSKGWDPFEIGTAKILFTTKNDDNNLSRYDENGSPYDGIYYIKMKISPTYTPFYLVYIKKLVYDTKTNLPFRVGTRVYTVAREQKWGDLYRNETNPSIWEHIVYFFQDLFE
jgi:hypothetical protein